MEPEWITPAWPAPPRVHALTTTRTGGFSAAPYDGFNLGDHVGDSAEAVAANRRLLRERLALPVEPLWLRQVHGCAVATDGQAASPCADAAVTDRPGVVCAVLSADCLPLFLCDRAGSRVGIVHAGWRGLADGVIESALDAMGVAGEELLCWLGPAIGPSAFEVGEEVREAFLRRDMAAETAFRPSANGRWLADLYRLARQRLETRGVSAVGGGGHCTFTERERFFSYRRDGASGRMASLIWME